MKTGVMVGMGEVIAKGPCASTERGSGLSRLLFLSPENLAWDGRVIAKTLPHPGDQFRSFLGCSLYHLRI